MDLRTPTTERRNGVKQEGHRRLIPGQRHKKKKRPTGKTKKLQDVKELYRQAVGEGVLEGKVLGTLSLTNYSTTSYVDS